jgi:hypothetical protein
VTETTIVLDAALYPIEAIAAARNAFREFCSVVEHPRPDPWDGVRLTLIPRPDAPPHAVDEFLNYALCAALERHLAPAETVAA